ncbi:hypothetical protein Tsubulata_014570 [Turnera subulata]|uniref:Calmodulin-binding domain-containing protein n=1 Tax=Turnera subulata TaxID=218843 RepID=A0A9Q0J7J3_9ROSI|nr:hypothetical protein Tsubulata_014570 [Turnera subulata]
MAGILLPDSISLKSDSIFGSSSIPENVSLPGNFESNIEPKGDYKRRNSTGNVSLPYSKVKILSRYLAASMGSCHDNCKNVSKEIAEPKRRSPPRLNRIKQVECKCPTGSCISVMDGKKKLTSSCVLTPGSKWQKPHIAAITNTKREASLSTKKEVVPPKPLLRSKTIGVPSNGTIDLKPKLANLKLPSTLPKKDSSSSKGDSRIQVNKRTSASVVNSHGPSIRERTELQRSKVKASISSKQNNSAMESASTSAVTPTKKILKRPPMFLSPRPNFKRPSSVNGRKNKNLKPAFPVKYLIDVGKEECELSSNENMPDKSLHAIGSTSVEKMTTLFEKSDKASDIPLAVSSSHNDKSSKYARNGIRNAQVSGLPAKKTFGSGKRIPATQNPPLSKWKLLARPQVSAPSLESASSSHSNAISKNVESEIRSRANRATSTTLASKSRPRNGVASNTKEKVSTSRKITYRKGKKQLELQPDTPRRLKFRRTLLRERQTGEAANRRLNLRKKEVDGKVYVSETEREDVVLKHQEWERKKEEQMLYNYMIEETANKLVKSKKGKVKALVNAFETVFSLQESKM